MTRPLSRYDGEWWGQNGIDLGDGHWIHFPDGPGFVYFAHRKCDGSICWGRLPVLGPESWRIVTRDPLTIEPSIVCEDHGIHGFIRNGRWVLA